MRFVQKLIKLNAKRSPVRSHYFTFPFSAYFASVCLENSESVTVDAREVVLDDRLTGCFEVIAFDGTAARRTTEKVFMVIESKLG